MAEIEEFNRIDEDDFFKEFEFSPAIKKFYNLAPDVDNQDEISESNLKVLNPDHPLLERFQTNFKEYLLKQIQRLREDVAELETGCKDKNAEREKLGVEAYETQQIVAKQQNDIDICIKELHTTVAAREVIALELAESHKRLKNEKNALLESERREIELRNEIESTDAMVRQMSKWEEDIESDLLINQRIAEKSRKEKLKLATQKKQQDMFLYKLTEELWRLETELETLLMQTNVKEADRERLAEAVEMTNIDIEANESDHRCLMHGWQSIIVTINVRNKYYNSLVDEYRNLKEKLDVIHVELLNTKKACNKELVKNETLTMFKDRVEQDRRITQHAVDREADKRHKIEACMAEYDSITARLQIDINRVKFENKTINASLGTTRRDIEQLAAKKIQLEENIVTLLNEKTTSLKQAHLLNNIISGLKETLGSLRIKVVHTENKGSKINNDISNTKFESREFDRLNANLNKEIENEDKELNECTKAIDKCEFQLSGLYRTFETLRTRLTSLEKEQDANRFLSPQEYKIKTLEGNIGEMMENNKELETIWLREQAIVVDLVNKRQAQMKEMNLIKKQILIVDQKNLKITDELEHYKKVEDNMLRSITTLQNQLAVFTEKLNRKKGSKENLDILNNKTQHELMERLEECELDSLKLKADLLEVEEDKSTLSNALIEVNRKALAWEKKIQIVNEMRKEVQKEKSEEGELGKMRSEIHRMNVRYSHLRKAQDKLLADLEHCVFRRENIVMLAEARTKYLTGGSQRMRFNFSKKIDDIKNKICQTENDTENVLLKTESRANDALKYEEHIKEIEMKIKEAHLCSNDMELVFDQKFIEKQLNLDILCFKQRKIKIYSELWRGRSPHTIYKTETAAQSAYDIERDFNSKLRIIVENLLSDFPQHNVYLSKVHNSLVLPAIHL